jgi:flagellar biosynthesis/type III secretory pathway M-ring protein FliF/YscJ
MDKDILLLSGSTPNLISEKTLRKLDKILENSKTVGSTNHLANIYNDYIKPNLFAILVLVVIVAFLVIRYIIKKYREENEEDSEEDSEEYIDEESIDEKPIKKIKAKIPDDDTFTDDFEDDITETQEENFDTHNKYEKIIEDNDNDNDGIVSDQYIREMQIKDNDRMAFDELSRRSQA